jgi:hypothetical protein
VEPERKRSSIDAIGGSTAIVTPSFALDFERCAVLCASIDAHVTGFERHYLLVAGQDVPLFRRLETSRRVVVDARELLPKWLILPTTFTFQRRQLYLSLRTRPQTGWHVQQLLKIAIAFHVPQEALLFCDSDVAFVRPYDVRAAWRGGLLRLYREHEGLARRRGPDHKAWVIQAGRLLGVPEEQLNGHDYIGQLISWRTDQVKAMCARIEDVASRPWAQAVAGSWNLSEYMIYGHYSEDVAGREGHFEDITTPCQTHWSGAPFTEKELRAWIDNLASEKAAICIQSYTDFAPRRLRALLGL